jgi:hypothetical protein
MNIYLFWLQTGAHYFFKNKSFSIQVEKVHLSSNKFERRNGYIIPNISLMLWSSIKLLKDLKENI